MAQRQKNCVKVILCLESLVAYVVVLLQGGAVRDSEALVA